MGRILLRLLFLSAKSLLQRWMPTWKPTTKRSRPMQPQTLAPIFHVSQRDTSTMKCGLPLVKAKKVAYQDQKDFYDLDNHVKLGYTVHICKGCLSGCVGVVVGQ